MRTTTRRARLHRRSAPIVMVVVVVVIVVVGLVLLSASRIGGIGGVIGLGTVVAVLFDMHLRTDAEPPAGVAERCGGDTPGRITVDLTRRS